MRSNEQFNFEFSKSPGKFPHLSMDITNSAAVYTMLCVLRKMKIQLGLEAMLEYAGKYLETVEKSDPRLKTAVCKVLSTINVERIYREANNKG